MVTASRLELMVRSSALPSAAPCSIPPSLPVPADAKAPSLVSLSPLSAPWLRNACPLRSACVLATAPTANLGLLSTGRPKGRPCWAPTHAHFNTQSRLDLMVRSSALPSAATAGRRQGSVAGLAVAARRPVLRLRLPARPAPSCAGSAPLRSVPPAARPERRSRPSGLHSPTLRRASAYASHKPPSLD
jgi:hypothetical protein